MSPIMLKTMFLMIFTMMSEKINYTKELIIVLEKMLNKYL